MHKLISSGVQVKAMEQRLRSAGCGQRAAVSGILHMQKQKIMTDRCRERAKEWRGGAGGGAWRRGGVSSCGRCELAKRCNNIFSRVVVAVVVVVLLVVSCFASVGSNAAYE